MFHRVRVGCVEVLPLQTRDLRASNEGDAMEFGVSQLDRAFSQLGIVCFSGFFSFFGSLRYSSNSFEVPPSFDHPKSIS